MAKLISQKQYGNASIIHKKENEKFRAIHNHWQPESKGRRTTSSDRATSSVSRKDDVSKIFLSETESNNLKVVTETRFNLFPLFNLLFPPNLGNIVRLQNVFNTRVILKLTMKVFGPNVVREALYMSRTSVAQLARGGNIETGFGRGCERRYDGGCRGRDRRGHG